MVQYGEDDEHFRKVVHVAELSVRNEYSECQSYRRHKGVLLGKDPRGICTHESLNKVTTESIFVISSNTRAYCYSAKISRIKTMDCLEYMVRIKWRVVGDVFSLWILDSKKLPLLYNDV